MKTSTKATVANFVGHFCFVLAVFDTVMAYVASKVDALQGQFGLYLFSAMLLITAAYLNWKRAEVLGDQAEKEAVQEKAKALRPDVK